MGILNSIKKRVLADLDPLLGPSFGDAFDQQPLTIYDVGAAGEAYCPIEGGPSERVRVYGFEPVKRSYDALIAKYASNPFVEHRQVALSDRDGMVTFNIFGEGQETLSSLLPRDGLDIQSRPMQVEAVRLDSVPQRFGFPPADLIKMDTEGSEAMILSQGQTMLNQETLGVVSEVTFWREDTDGAVFSDVDRILTGAGFVLFDLQVNRSHNSTIGGKKDKLRTGDALYLRDFSHLAVQIDGASSEHRRTKLVKLVCLCVSWRYLNYACELIDHGRREGLISSEEFALLSNAFVSVTDLAQRIPDFPGRAAIVNLADTISYALHKKAKKGTPAGFNQIGNPWVVTRRSNGPTKLNIYKPVINDGASKHMKSINLRAERE